MKSPHPAVIGPTWAMGWLFTIGFAKLTGWKILFSLFIWPYYIGKIIAHIANIVG